MQEPSSAMFLEEQHREEGEQIAENFAPHFNSLYKQYRDTQESERVM